MGSNISFWQVKLSGVSQGCWKIWLFHFLTTGLPSNKDIKFQPYIQYFHPSIHISTLPMQHTMQYKYSNSHNSSCFFEKVFTDVQSSEEDSSEGSFDMDSCAYCSRTCTAMARTFGAKRFCSNTCAKLFGIPLPKRGGMSGGMAGRGRGRWKHYLGSKVNSASCRKLPNVSLILIV